MGTWENAILIVILLVGVLAMSQGPRK